MASETLPALEFVPPGRLRERLNDAVLRGVKTATSRLLVMDELAGTPVEPIGTRLRLLDSAGGTAALVESTGSALIPLAGVDREVSDREGDWFADPAEWRAAHERFWAPLVPGIRAALADPEWCIGAETPVAVRFFRLVEA